MNLSFLKKLLHGAIVPLLVLALWQALSMLGWINPQIMPSPLAVMRKWGEYLAPTEAYTPQLGSYALWLLSGELLHDAYASMSRVIGGFLIGAVLALPLGLLMGTNKTIYKLFDPLIQVLRPISPLAWIPIAILWLGVGDLSAIFLIFLASFLPLTVTAMNAVAAIPDVYVNAARNFGLQRGQLLYRVLYPAVMPQLIIGLRIALGIAWLVVVAAEMIAVDSGLGFLIVDARNAGNRYDLVVAGMVMIGLIGLLLDSGMRSLERARSIRWGYSED